MAAEGVIPLSSTPGSSSASSHGLDPSEMGEINSWFAEANALDEPTIDILSGLPDVPDPRRVGGVVRIITNLFRVIASKLTTVWTVVIAMNNKIEGLTREAERVSKYLRGRK